MALAPTEWDTLTDIVRAASRDCVLPRFRNLDAADVAIKSSVTDLVTLADTEAEAQMTAALRSAWPGVVVVGEEAVSAEPASLDAIDTAERVVILDPVDGTWNFAKGLALFGMIVAVAEAGRTIAGMLYDPLFDDWIIADHDGPALYVRAGAGQQTLRTSPLTVPGQISGYLPLGLLPEPARAEAIARTADFTRVLTLRCSCHEYRMLAQGHAEFVLSGPVPNAWDHAAGALIVERAGGVARMLDGASYRPGLTSGYLLTAASQEVWDLCADRLSFLSNPGA